MAETTLIEELEEAARRIDCRCRGINGGPCARELEAGRLRARVEHVRRFMAVSALLNPDGKDFADKLTGPIPPSDETARCAFGALTPKRCSRAGTMVAGGMNWCDEHHPPVIEPDARDEIGCECPRADSMDCLRASDERVDVLGDHYEGEGCGCDCHDFHATPHVQSVVAHADKPWFRCECSCGWRGMWLRDKAKVMHCPRTPLGDAERATGFGGAL